MNDRLKRIRFRAWRRGFREMDLIMGGFADAHLQELDDAAVAAFEALLREPDQDVYDWILSRRAPPAAHETPLLDLLRSYRFFAYRNVKTDTP